MEEPTKQFWEGGHFRAQDSLLAACDDMEQHRDRRA
jgi:hypothetical protein